MDDNFDGEEIVAIKNGRKSYHDKTGRRHEQQLQKSGDIRYIEIENRGMRSLKVNYDARILNVSAGFRQPSAIALHLVFQCTKKHNGDLRIWKIIYK